MAASVESCDNGAPSPGIGMVEGSRDVRTTVAIVTGDDDDDDDDDDDNDDDDDDTVNRTDADASFDVEHTGTVDDPRTV